MAKKLNKKILIVEDDKDFLSILETKFTGEGFSVVTAENGEDGITVAEAEKPDLIFSDILLPQMDGLEMAKKIKETNKDVLVIFLTNIKDDAYIDDIKKSEGFYYLVKSDSRLNDVVKEAKNKLGVK